MQFLPLSFSRVLAVCLLVSLAACSGSRNQSLDNQLGTGRRDGGDAEADPNEPDAEEDVPADEQDEPDATLDGGGSEGEEAAVQDAASMDAGAVDSGVQDAGSEAAVDASVSDAGDASDAGPARHLRLTVTRGGVPLPNLFVLFHGVENVLVGNAETDARGVVETDRVVSHVTVSLPHDSDAVRADLFTFFGVEDGDDLKLDVLSAPDSRAAYVMNVTQPVDGAHYYFATGGREQCASGGSYSNTQTIYVSSLVPCLAESGNDLLVSAWTNNRSGLLSYALVSDVDGPPDAGGTTDVSVGAFSGVRSVELALSGLSSFEAPLVNTSLWAVLRNQQLPLVTEQPDTLGADGTVTFAAPNAAFDALLSRAVWKDGISTRRAEVRSANAQAAAAIDLSRMLPMTTSFGFNDTSLRAPRVEWSIGESAQRDAILFEVTLSIRSSTTGNEAFQLSWSGITRPSASQVDLPGLPTELVPVTPDGFELQWQAARLSQLRSSLIDGYRGFRNETLHFRANELGDLVRPSLNAAGESELVTWERRD